MARPTTDGAEVVEAWYTQHLEVKVSAAHRRELAKMIDEALHRAVEAEVMKRFKYSGL